MHIYIRFDTMVCMYVCIKISFIHLVEIFIQSEL